MRSYKTIPVVLLIDMLGGKKKEKRKKKKPYGFKKPSPDRGGLTRSRDLDSEPVRDG